MKKKSWYAVRNFLFSGMNKEFLIFLFFLALSLSHITTEEEVTVFLQAFADCYNTLTR